MAGGSRRSVAYDPRWKKQVVRVGSSTLTNSKVTRWYAHNTRRAKVVCTHTLWLRVRIEWGLELPEMLLEPERASHTWLHATLKEGERMRLRTATLGTWGGSGRAVGAALRG